MARSAAEMLAFSCVALVKVVVRALPFQFTTEAATKLEPVTVRVKSESPLLALVGEIEVTLGSGLPFPFPPGRRSARTAASATGEQHTGHYDQQHQTKFSLHVCSEKTITPSVGKSAD